PPPPRAAVARAAGPASGPVLRLAQRDHAAADDGCNRRSLFWPIHGALARGFGARGRLARRGTQPVAGAWLLRPGAQSPPLRAGGGGGARRALSKHGRG